MGMFTHPYGQCAQCGAKIVEYDDDAHVCIRCGGRNRPLEPVYGMINEPSWPVVWAMWALMIYVVIDAIVSG